MESNLEFEIISIIIQESVFRKDDSGLIISFNLTPSFIAHHKDNIILCDINEIIANKNELNKDAVIVPALALEGSLEPEDLVLLMKSMRNFVI